MASTMVSPSSVTVRRTVPCIAGCEGPRFTVMGVVGISASSDSGSWSCSASVIGARIDVLAADVRLAHRDAGAARTGAGAAHQVGEVELGDEGLALADGIVLAQGEADELRVHENARQVRVPGELEPEHVVHVALPPVGGPV